MIGPTLSASEKRRRLRDLLGSGSLVKCPGAISPLVAKLIEQKGFDAAYISGAVLSADLGLPDIGLISSAEVAARGAAIARGTDLPVIIDVDTGFGEPVNAARTITMMEEAGIAGCHLEDQISLKRCGHLDNKELVPVPTMVARIRAAVSVRRDPAFLIIARTDARASEGLEAAIARARAYVEAGADMIFPEALQDVQEFKAFRTALSVPLMANMTEFGKSPLLNAKELEALGYNMAIYPVTLLRLAMKAIERGLDSLVDQGDQKGLLASMQSREELYELLDYAAYGRFGDDIVSFKS